LSAEYGEDLAWVHHAGYGDVAEKAAATLQAELAGVHGGLVVDLGCGSGILARRLTGAGFEVLGVDSSEAMLGLAAAEAPDARFVHASLADCDIPPCVAVTAVGEAINYAGVDLAGLFGRVAAALPGGGVFVFDVAGPGRLREAVHMREDPAGEWLIARRGTEDGLTLTRHITLFRHIGETYRRSDETHTLRLYDPDEVVEQLGTAGFSVTPREGYGDTPMGPGWKVFVAHLRPQ
jgi:SAM-dependent methyltransferase